MYRLVCQQFYSQHIQLGFFLHIRLEVIAYQTGYSCKSDWLFLHIRLLILAYQTGYSCKSDWLFLNIKQDILVNQTGYSCISDWVFLHIRLGVLAYQTGYSCISDQVFLHTCISDQVFFSFRFHRCQKISSYTWQCKFTLVLLITSCHFAVINEIINAYAPIKNSAVLTFIFFDNNHINSYDMQEKQSNTGLW